VNRVKSTPQRRNVLPISTTFCSLEASISMSESQYHSRSVSGRSKRLLIHCSYRSFVIGRLLSAAAVDRAMLLRNRQARIAQTQDGVTDEGAPGVTGPNGSIRPVGTSRYAKVGGWSIVMGPSHFGRPARREEYANVQKVFAVECNPDRLASGWQHHEC